MKKFTSKSQITGELGEHIACRYLEEKGFEILERNYTRRWGEIDIIVRKDGRVHFIEVKSVSRENVRDISHETPFRPEDQMHSGKQERLKRTIETYLARGDIAFWQFDLACVYIDEKAKKARIRMMKDLILG